MCPQGILCLYEHASHMLWERWYAQLAMACVEACSQERSSPFRESPEICIGSASQKHEAHTEPCLYGMC